MEGDGSGHFLTGEHVPVEIRLVEWTLEALDVRDPGRLQILDDFEQPGGSGKTLVRIDDDAQLVANRILDRLQAFDDRIVVGRFHLEHGVALCHDLFGEGGGIVGIHPTGTTRDRHLITVLAAEKTIGGKIVGFAHQIVERHFESGIDRRVGEPHRFEREFLEIERFEIPPLEKGGGLCGHRLPGSPWRPRRDRSARNRYGSG